jgi:creatinine amidohydrolase/Fe(II)-dependent formamide hydrolase-like protein
MVMYLHPGVVRKRDVPIPEKRERKYTTNYVRMRELFPDGSINSNPNLASEENGRKIFEACVEAYIEEMEEWD